MRLVKNASLTIDEWKDMQLRSFLGITIQYIKKFEIKSINMACEPLHDSHTGEYLSEMIIKFCDVSGLSQDKIVSITTDNGSIIVKAIETTFGRAKHVRCLAHTLNLVVDNSVNIPEIEIFLDKVRKIVTWFHQSGVDAEELRQTKPLKMFPREN